MTWELAEDLGKALGHVALLTGHPDTLAKGSEEGVSLYPAPTYDRGSYPRRAISWLRYVIHAFFWLRRWPRTVPVLLFSNPPLLCWLGYLMRKLRGQPYAVMIHDIYPDVLVKLKGFSEGSLLIRLWCWLNRRAYENASVVMTLGECMARTLVSHLDPTRTRAGRVKVIYPWVDSNRIKPLPKDKNWFAEKHGQVGKMTVAYSGNMGISHGLEAVLAAASRLRDVAGIHFLLIGDGKRRPLLEQIVRRDQLVNVTILPWQDETALPYSLATGDIAIVCLDAGAEGLMIPSKALYAMAAGSAILAICPEDTELADWVREFGFGRRVVPGDGEGLVTALRGFLSEPSTLDRCRKRARLTAIQRFSRKANTARLAQALAIAGPNQARWQPRIRHEPTSCRE